MERKIDALDETTGLVVVILPHRLDSCREHRAQDYGDGFVLLFLYSKIDRGGGHYNRHSVLDGNLYWMHYVACLSFSVSRGIFFYLLVDRGHKC